MYQDFSLIVLIANNFNVFKDVLLNICIILIQIQTNIHKSIFYFCTSWMYLTLVEISQVNIQINPVH
jgi:hypothetical protein